MSEFKTCPKCGGEMIRGAKETFGNVFGCTREPKNLDALHGKRIQSYWCSDCGFIEFYQEKNK